MNSFGRIFRISMFGESHGHAIGVTLDGVPCGIDLKAEDFLEDLGRRKAGAKGTTPRQEDDLPEIVSGCFDGKTTGVPLTILFKNLNTRSEDYNNLLEIPRPGHSDFVAWKRFKGCNDPRGGGHFSGRLTLTLVAAGVVAKKIIEPISVNAKLVEVGGSKEIEETIGKALEAGDSLGGLVSCVAKNIPIGWGEPFFDSVESVISHLVFAIPAIKGIEFGSGFKAAEMKGSEHNDAILDAQTGLTASNHAGGITGGLTNGNPLVFRVAVKPTSSISMEQKTVNIRTGNMDTLQVKGRHDACIALRVPVVVEAVTAIALADFKLLAQAH